MISVDNSICHCGQCGKSFPVEWDLEPAGSQERGMGEEYYYTAEEEFICPFCGNTIAASLEAYEYPVGALNYSHAKIDRDDSGESTIDTPDINFFDL